MRKQLEPAQQGQTLRDVLGRIGPPELAPFLRADPGFRIRAEGSDDGIVRVTGDRLRYRLAGTEVSCDIAIELSPELGIAVQSATITNEGRRPSPPIRELHAFHLPLDVLVQHCPRAGGFGGGLTHGFYPPQAYRPEEVCFGQSREWEPTDPSFTRWWTGKRVYFLASGPDGRSSNPSLPLMHIGWESGDATLGLWAALEWSGRWEMQMGTGMDGRFTFRGGPKVQDLVLEPGESIELPGVHVGVYGGDGVNSIRRYIAEVLSPDVEGERPEPLIAYDHWFGIEHWLSDALLRKQVDRAAELGLEYFVVDAGWYGGASENFADGVGNWERVDESKFPRGLEPFAEYVRSRGLRFGLWFEPERARAGSDWLRDHPEWYWQADSPVNSHLDLTRGTVQNALIRMLSGWIERLDIRWLRWDYNQPPGPFWDAVDSTGKVQFAYMKGLYRVLDMLLERHPNLMIDNCAGGGQRIDFGTLRRAGTMVISDHAEDPHICRIMQTGGARVFPANYTNSSVYIGEHDGDDAVGPLELMSRMAGSITLCGHIANWSERQTRRVRKHLDGYRTFRHLLTKDFHALSPYPRSPADWDVVQFLDPDTGEAVILAYRVRGDRKTQTLLPVHLAAERAYEIIDPFSSRKGRTATGGALMDKGLRLSLPPDSAAVRHLKPV
ncbi:MAG: glycoside hydrolase family 36 protein [Armatimonadota bacterium]